MWGTSHVKFPPLRDDSGCHIKPFRLHKVQDEGQHGILLLALAREPHAHKRRNERTSTTQTVWNDSKGAIVTIATGGGAPTFLVSRRRG